MTEAKPRAPSIPLLFAMLFAGQLGSNIYVPGIPDIARDLSTTVSAAQSLVAAYLGAFAVAQMVMGPLSDRFGRRPVIVAGMALFALASIACAVAPNIGLLLSARFAQAFGACATIVVGRAMIRDTSEGLAAAQAMSWLATAMGIGPATAPFFGGFLVAWFGWQSTFLATALIAAGVLVVVLVNLEETLPPAQRRSQRMGPLIRTYFRLVRNPTFVGYSMIVAFASGAMQSYLTAVPIIFLVLMHVPPQIFGIYIMIMPILYVIATYASRKLMTYISVDQIILLGSIFSVTGGVLQLAFGLWGVTTPYPVLFAFAISNLGTGLVFGGCYAQALSTVEPAIAGQASALGGFLHMGWGATISLITANMTHTSSLQFGIAQMTTGTLAAVTAFGLFYWIKPRRKREAGKRGVWSDG